MKRSVPEVLKLVAESRHYSTEYSKGTCKYMCFSLHHAQYNGLITEEEKSRCFRSIHKYLTKMYDYVQEDMPNSPELKKALELNGLPCEFKDTKAVYLNWKNRPKPWKQ